METVSLDKKLLPFLSIGGNVVIFWAYLMALLYPTDNVSFYYYTGSLILLIEFLNLHSTGMTMGSEKYDLKNKVVLLGAYSVFALVFFAISKNYVLILYFFISLLSKIFFNGSKDVKSNLRHYLITFMIFLCVMGLMLGFGWIFTALIQLPPEVLNHRPANVSGLMVESPQIFIAGGLLYFASLIIFESISLLKRVPVKLV